jgi:hypothetical protein
MLLLRNLVCRKEAAVKSPIGIHFSGKFLASQAWLPLEITDSDTRTSPSSLSFSFIFNVLTPRQDRPYDSFSEVFREISGNQ